MKKEQIRQSAFDVFDKLQIGQSINIESFATKDPTGFIQYGKDYIDQGGSIIFSNDYSVITKIQSWQSLMSEIQSKNQKVA